MIGAPARAPSGPLRLAEILASVGARDSGPEFAEATELTARAMPSARVEWVDGGHLIDAAHPAVLGFVDGILGRRVAPVPR